LIPLPLSPRLGAGTTLYSKYFIMALNCAVS
jgi:hypothetical protein